MIEYIASLVSSPVAIIGLLASIIVLVSMCFNTRTCNGELAMRIINLVGSILSMIYGVLLGPDGFGMLILNTPLVFVNFFYIVKSLRSTKDDIS